MQPCLKACGYVTTTLQYVGIKDPVGGIKEITEVVKVYMVVAGGESLAF